MLFTTILKVGLSWGNFIFKFGIHVTIWICKHLPMITLSFSIPCNYNAQIWRQHIGNLERWKKSLPNLSQKLLRKLKLGAFFGWYQDYPSLGNVDNVWQLKKVKLYIHTDIRVWSFLIFKKKKTQDMWQHTYPIHLICFPFYFLLTQNSYVLPYKGLIVKMCLLNFIKIVNLHYKFIIKKINPLNLVTIADLYTICQIQ